MPKAGPRYLIVEGNSDKQLIVELCKKHGIPELVFDFPARGGGIQQLLESIPIRISEPGIEILGIVVDADTDVSARWQALRDRLQHAAILQEKVYESFPATPPSNGWISNEAHSPRVGVWLMPNNSDPGILEDFARRMIAADDPLLTKAIGTVEEIEQSGLRRHTDAERPRVIVHTWLAWQEESGRPLGQAVAHGYLRHDTPLALAFIAWLQRLLAPTTPTPEVA